MKHRILLVDDEIDILEFVRYNLVREGYEVFTAENGAEALRLAAEHRPHLILLDRMMPVMDGAETCRAIRNDPQLKDSMVVFLSALGEEEQQLTGFGAGADDYLTKPIKMKLLVSRVRAILNRISKRRRSPRPSPPRPPASRSTAPATRSSATAAKSSCRARSSRCSSCSAPRPDGWSRARRSTPRSGDRRWWSATARSTCTSANCVRRSAKDASRRSRA